jgi:AraC-like DNA-binding protein
LASPWIPPLDKGGTDDVIDDALNYIFTNSAREIRLADVAARAAMSESGFSRYFRRSAGQSFSDTVRKLRLAHACQLLENTDEPISTICHRTGYQNLSNFNRQFRREHGTPPASTAEYTKTENSYSPVRTRPNPNPETCSTRTSPPQLVASQPDPFHHPDRSAPARRSAARSVTSSEFA